MSKDTLIKHLSHSGKDMSWEQLATIHKIKNGEAARNIWKRHRTNQGSFQIDLTMELERSKKGKLEKLIAEAKTPLEYIKMKQANAGRTQLVEISFPDLHIGKLAWDKETGEDYDITIAVSRAKDAVGELISRLDVTKVDRILLPLGNDLISVDNKMGTTTMGTPQSADGRFGKMFRATKDLVIDTVTALNKIAPVDILIVPGNHDESTMFTLGEVLEAWYKDDKGVTVNNSPKLRKYYQYGKCMLMFTHGDKEKHSELGLIAAHEQAEMWGQTKYRECHLGHLHKSKSMAYTIHDEFKGFKVRILPSLSGMDAWHYANGYFSDKAAKAFVYEHEKGMVTEHTYTV